MSYAPQSQEWRSDRALLLVHGVGNAAPGDYRILHERIREILGDSAKDFAIYQLYYDSINDWFTEKTELRERIDSMLGIVSEGVPRGTIGDLLSEFIGDVLWPVLSQAARTAVREAYLAQLKQIVLDGIASGHRPKRQKLSIVCHSLGCFHTYEALHAAASDPSHGLQPATHGVRFKNVVYMASPVQLIRSVASRISGLVPSHRMATLDPEGLRLPGEDALGMRIESVDNWISITGSLDPIGGFFLGGKRSGPTWRSPDSSRSSIHRTGSCTMTRSYAWSLRRVWRIRSVRRKSKTRTHTPGWDTSCGMPRVSRRG